MKERPSVGTVVYLETGSPPMIVSSIRRTDGLVMVEWFDKEGVLKRDAFDPECIFVETLELRDLRARCLNNMKAHMINGTVEGLLPGVPA